MRGELRMDDTGEYLVEIMLGTDKVPGSGYNLTVFPGPPDAQNSAMQVLPEVLSHKPP